MNQPVAPIVFNESRLMRRVAGIHNYRLDGIGDLLLRARDAAVLDLGCSHGQVGQDFVINGAKLLHGCDRERDCVEVARRWFFDYRSLESRFEVVDLSIGPDAMHAFGDQRYDIVLMIATYHKIKRQMSPDLLSALMIELGGRTKQFLGWRGTSDKPEENEQEMVMLDRDLGACGLMRVQTSTISKTLGLAAIWERMG